MNKHRYQALDLQRMDWIALSQEVAGHRLIFSVDVAKENFYGAFMVPPFTVLGIVKWRHPSETPTLGGFLSALPATSIEVALEPSGTYGDSLREFLRGLGFELYLVSPKRVHDAAEVYKSKGSVSNCFF